MTAERYLVRPASFHVSLPFLPVRETLDMIKSVASRHAKAVSLAKQLTDDNLLNYHHDEERQSERYPFTQPTI